MPRGAHLPKPKKGERPGGRQKGTPNKITKSMREAFMNAFNNAGGEEALAAFARRDRKTFYQICSKLIPVELVGKGGKNLIPPSVTLPKDPLAAAAAYREIMKQGGDEEAGND